MKRSAHQRLDHAGPFADAADSDPGTADFKFNRDLFASRIARHDRFGHSARVSRRSGKERSAGANAAPDTLHRHGDTNSPSRADKHVFGFDSASVAAVSDRRSNEENMRRSETAATAPTLVDHWILERLGQVVAECRAAYEAYEFHKVYHTLNQFCAVDLSSLYIDITKDRMYCDAPDSPRRRATQAAMHEIFDALCRLLAPVLAFTADEAWQYANSAGSVHLQELPAAPDRREEASAKVNELLKLRGIIGQAIEKARQEKLIGNALEAAVVLDSNSDVTSEIGKEELEEFFILSDLTVRPAKEAGATVSKTEYKKCARCWRHRPTVGASAAHPELCDRCEDVVKARPAMEGRAPASP